MNYCNRRYLMGQGKSDVGTESLPGRLVEHMSPTKKAAHDVDHGVVVHSSSEFVIAPTDSERS